MSPPFWLICFNPVPRRLTEGRTAFGSPLPSFRDVFSAESLETPVLRARPNVPVVKSVMDSISFSINVDKT